MQTEKNLIDFEKRWDEAMIRNDADEIGKFLSDDWIIVGSDGITGKASFLESVRSGDLIHTRMDYDDIHIKVYGDNGVIICRGTSAGIYKGESFSLYEWSTSTCLYNGQDWVCVATMVTKADK